MSSTGDDFYILIDGEAASEFQSHGLWSNQIDFGQKMLTLFLKLIRPDS